MAYLAPAEFVTKMVDAGESKIFMSTRDTLIRAFMAGAILALAAVFAVTLVLYRSGKYRATPKMTRMFMIAMIGYGVFSLLNFVLMMTGTIDGMFGMRSGLLGLGIGVLAVLL